MSASRRLAVLAVLPLLLGGCVDAALEAFCPGGLGCPSEVPDGGSDAGVDAGEPDAGLPDAGAPDSGMPDSGLPDAGEPDAGVPDAGTPDAGDAGPVDSGVMLPLLTVDRLTYDFGPGVVGQLSTPLTLTLTNAGTGNAATIAAGLTGSGAMGFVAPDLAPCQDLAPAATCQVAVPFAPNGLGTFMAALGFTATPGGSMANVTLLGSGVAAGTLSVVPGAIDFGDVVQFASSSTQTFRVSNGGGSPTGMLATTLGGSDALSFAITSDGCAGQSLDPGTSCTLTARFSPGIAGARRGTLAVTANPGGAAVATLIGRGLAVGSLGLMPTSRDLGQVAVGAQGTPLAFQVINTGMAPTGTLATSLGGQHAGELAVVTDNCDGAVLGPGESCDLTVRLVPASPGDKLASLLVSGAPGGSATSALSGIGLRPPALVPSDNSEDFGITVTGQSSAAVIQISNPGALQTGIITTALSGPDAVQFALSLDRCIGLKLDAGTSCDLTVSHSPHDAGTHVAQLDVSATPGGLTTIALTGLAQTPGALGVMPASHDFGSVEQNTTALTPRTFTFTNSGGSSTGMLSTSITGTGATNFFVMSQTCAGTTLPSMGTCTVTVNFTPTTTGPKSATLIVSGMPGGAASATLSGRGLKPAALAFTPTSFTFPSLVVGDIGGTQQFTLTNTGEVGTGNLAVSLTGMTTSISISGNTCGTAPLGPGASCIVTLSWHPVPAAVLKSVSLSASATPGGTAAAAASGTALTPAALIVTPSPQAFGSTVLNSTIQKTMTVTNAGQGPSSAMTLTKGGTDMGLFSIVAPVAGECVSGVTKLVGNGLCQFRVNFTPTTAGAKAATVVANAADGGSATFPDGGSSTASLSGTGLTQAALMGSPATLPFGSLAIGKTSTAMGWTVTNSGAVPTGNLTLSITGTDSSQFTQTSTCGTTIAAGGNCVVSVTFKPTSGGPKSATVQLTANPGGSASAMLTGTGTMPLTVTKAGTGTGTITSMPGGINCGADCTEDLTLNTVVTLTAATTNNGSSYFQSWGGDCASFGATHTCTVTMSAARNVTATFAPQTYNLAFISSQTYAANLGGVAAYDTKCNTLATAAGINNATNNAYIAWMSAGTSTAVSRLGASARGFVRVDGLPFADDQTSWLTNKKIFYPLRVDELGNTVSGASIVTWTGTSADGLSTGTTCTLWTTNAAGTIGSVGRGDGGPYHWSYDSTSPCNASLRIYCIGKTKTAAYTPPAVSGKRVWRSNTDWPVAGGISGADAKCMAEKPAGVVTARALLNTTAAGIPVVSTTTYFRPDNIIVGTGAELLANTVRTGIWQAADGSYPNGFYVVTGGGLPSSPQTAANCCNNWANNTSSYFLTRAAYVFHGEWWASRGDPCNVTEPIYCVEQ